MDPTEEAAKKLVAEWKSKGYYEVLDVPKDASASKIKHAYYKLARQYHPDKNEEPGAEEVFKLINEAYQVLIDEEKRALYDKYGKAGVQGAEGGASDPIDMMKAMFGGDSFNDTFGDLNMWESIKIQMMVAAGAQMTEEEVKQRLEQFAKERKERLVIALISKLEPFVTDNLDQFKSFMENDVAEKAAAPGGASLLSHVGYVYCQVAQQFMDRFLGLGSVFAKVAEKGHRFKNNMSALGAAVKLTYSAVKLQQKMEEEEMAKVRQWSIDHPNVPFPGTCTYDDYPFELDDAWLSYKRNVEIPDGADKEAAMEKVRHKWYENNIEVHHREYIEKEMGEQEGADGVEGALHGENGDDMKRVFDQGLKLMWKLGIMEAEEICRDVCREICEPKSEFNVTNKTTKEEIKRRTLGIHHIGEKFKLVSAKLKKEEKKSGFSFDEFLAKEQSAKSPRSSDGEADAKTDVKGDFNVADDFSAKTAPPVHNADDVD